MVTTILADNNTLIDKYYLGEPAFSAFIEDKGVSVLFDVGYSGVFLQNALKMGISFKNLQYVCLSHGHMDHTWGLDPLIRYYTELEQEHTAHTEPGLIAHPSVFRSISVDGFSEAGSLLSAEKLGCHFDMCLSREPKYITGQLVFLGEIPRTNDFEVECPIGVSGGKPDYVKDDSALVYTGEDGLVIITGCSHSGICNIVEYAKRVTGETVIADIIGGFHLLNPSRERLEGTCRYLQAQKIKGIHPCHCTDLRSKITLAAAVPVEETGVSARYEFR
ncbi:MAG: MBL fold metallo-hydrolase [Treponema sp.]|nr:MBL fold metallo-hydrolase [Treponema sp.]